MVQGTSYLNVILEEPLSSFVNYEIKLM